MYIFWVPNAIQEIAIEIAKLAILTGVATINGQEWIEGLDYAEAVDLVLTEDPQLLTHLAVDILDLSRQGWGMVEFRVLTTFGLLSNLMAAWGKDTVELRGRTVGEMAENISKGLNGIADEEILKKLMDATAALADGNFSAVFQMRKVISSMVALMRSLDTEFDDFCPEFQVFLLEDTEAIPKTVFNDLEVEFKLKDGIVHGFVFGIDFCRAFERTFTEEQYDDASSFLAKSVAFKVIRPVERDGGEEFETEREGGLEAYEDFTEEMISEGKKLRFGDFQSIAADFNGAFKWLAYMRSGDDDEEELLQLFAIAKQGQVIEFTIILPPIY
ncbi:hypothetical protein BDR26DRAFT_869267 [Obelidium mucronatum]|nr:hypothetical protein BDR26DRAFT_869267 [Obelidium mucronatum]